MGRKNKKNKSNSKSQSKKVEEDFIVDQMAQVSQPQADQEYSQQSQQSQMSKKLQEQDQSNHKHQQEIQNKQQAIEPTETQSIAQDSASNKDKSASKVELQQNQLELTEQQTDKTDNIKGHNQEQKTKQKNEQSPVNVISKNKESVPQNAEEQAAQQQTSSPVLNQAQSQEHTLIDQLAGLDQSNFDEGKTGEIATEKQQIKEVVQLREGQVDRQDEKKGEKELLKQEHQKVIQIQQSQDKKLHQNGSQSKDPENLRHSSASSKGDNQNKNVSVQKAQKIDQLANIEVSIIKPVVGQQTWSRVTPSLQEEEDVTLHISNQGNQSGLDSVQHDESKDKNGDASQDVQNQFDELECRSDECFQNIPDQSSINIEGIEQSIVAPIDPEKCMPEQSSIQIERIEQSIVVPFDSENLKQEAKYDEQFEKIKQAQLDIEEVKGQQKQQFNGQIVKDEAEQANHTENEAQHISVNQSDQDLPTKQVKQQTVNKPSLSGHAKLTQSCILQNGQGEPKERQDSQNSKSDLVSWDGQTDSAGNRILPDENDQLSEVHSQVKKQAASEYSLVEPIVSQQEEGKELKQQPPDRQSGQASEKSYESNNNEIKVFMDQSKIDIHSSQKSDNSEVSGRQQRVTSEDYTIENIQAAHEMGSYNIQQEEYTGEQQDHIIPQPQNLTQQRDQSQTLPISAPTQDYHASAANSTNPSQPEQQQSSFQPPPLEIEELRQIPELQESSNTSENVNSLGMNQSQQMNCSQLSRSIDSFTNHNSPKRTSSEMQVHKKAQDQPTNKIEISEDENQNRQENIPITKEEATEVQKASTQQMNLVQPESMTQESSLESKARYVDTPRYREVFASPNESQQQSQLNMNKEPISMKSNQMSSTSQPLPLKKTFSFDNEEVLEVQKGESNTKVHPISMLKKPETLNMQATQNIKTDLEEQPKAGDSAIDLDSSGQESLKRHSSRSVGSPIEKVQSRHLMKEERKERDQAIQQQSIPQQQVSHQPLESQEQQTKEFQKQRMTCSPVTRNCLAQRKETQIEQPCSKQLKPSYEAGTGKSYSNISGQFCAPASVQSQFVTRVWADEPSQSSGVSKSSSHSVTSSQSGSLQITTIRANSRQPQFLGRGLAINRNLILGSTSRSPSNDTFSNRHDSAQIIDKDKKNVLEQNRGLHQEAQQSSFQQFQQNNTRPSSAQQCSTVASSIVPFSQSVPDSIPTSDVEHPHPSVIVQQRTDSSLCQVNNSMQSVGDNCNSLDVFKQEHKYQDNINSPNSQCDNPKKLAINTLKPLDTEIARPISPLPILEPEEKQIKGDQQTYLNPYQDLETDQSKRFFQSHSRPVEEAVIDELMATYSEQQGDRVMPIYQPVIAERDQFISHESGQDSIIKKNELEMNKIKEQTSTNVAMPNMSDSHQCVIQTTKPESPQNQYSQARKTEIKVELAEESISKQRNFNFDDERETISYKEVARMTQPAYSGIKNQYNRDAADSRKNITTFGHDDILSKTKMLTERFKSCLGQTTISRQMGDIKRTLEKPLWKHSPPKTGENPGSVSPKNYPSPQRQTAQDIIRKFPSHVNHAQSFDLSSYSPRLHFSIETTQDHPEEQQSSPYQKFGSLNTSPYEKLGSLRSSPTEQQSQDDTFMIGVKKIPMDSPAQFKEVDKDNEHNSINSRIKSDDNEQVDVKENAFTLARDESFAKENKKIQQSFQHHLVQKSYSNNKIHKSFGKIPYSCSGTVPDYAKKQQQTFPLHTTDQYELRWKQQLPLDSSEPSQHIDFPGDRARQLTQPAYGQPEIQDNRTFDITFDKCESESKPLSASHLNCNKKPKENRHDGKIHILIKARDKGTKGKTFYEKQSEPVSVQAPFLYKNNDAKFMIPEGNSPYSHYSQQYKPTENFSHIPSQNSAYQNVNIEKEKEIIPFEAQFPSKPQSFDLHNRNWAIPATQMQLRQSAALKRSGIDSSDYSSSVLGNHNASVELRRNSHDSRESREGHHDIKSGQFVQANRQDSKSFHGGDFNKEHQRNRQPRKVRVFSKKQVESKGAFGQHTQANNDNQQPNDSKSRRQKIAITLNKDHYLKPKPESITPNKYQIARLKNGSNPYKNYPKPTGNHSGYNNRDKRTIITQHKAPHNERPHAQHRKLTALAGYSKKQYVEKKFARIVGTGERVTDNHGSAQKIQVVSYPSNSKQVATTKQQHKKVLNPINYHSKQAESKGQSMWEATRPKKKTNVTVNWTYNRGRHGQQRQDDVGLSEIQNQEVDIRER